MEDCSSVLAAKDWGYVRVAYTRTNSEETPIEAVKLRRVLELFQMKKLDRLEKLILDSVPYRPKGS